ncbi:DUF1266 domain-containing protein [Streptomyces sp. NPDC001594]|uniref:DUF1266 domain-containing protein n=1 Tax=Streptomyces sp. NPDC001594 TaxID=3364590 RepID=UPI00369DA3A4
MCLAVCTAGMLPQPLSDPVYNAYDLDWFAEVWTTRDPPYLVVNPAVPARECCPPGPRAGRCGGTTATPSRPRSRPRIPSTPWSRAVPARGASPSVWRPVRTSPWPTAVLERHGLPRRRLRRREAVAGAVVGSHHPRAVAEQPAAAARRRHGQRGLGVRPAAALRHGAGLRRPCRSRPLVPGRGERAAPARRGGGTAPADPGRHHRGHPRGPGRAGGPSGGGAAVDRPDQRYEARFRADGLLPDGGYVRSVEAWDYGRASGMARWGLGARLCAPGEAEAAVVRARRLVHDNYRSWEDFSAGYILGRCLHFDDEEFGEWYESVLAVHRLITTDPTSPWRTLPWA